MRKPAVALLGIAVVVPLALLLSACGGGSAPGVASLGTTTTTAASATTSAGSNGTASNASQQDSQLAYSKCMRSHGVPNFPDPGKTGGIQISPSMGIDITSPTFEAAQKTCQSLQPKGKPSAAQLEKTKKDSLAFSKCMRSHGVPNFPDPQFTAGGISLKITAKSGIDPTSPTFQAAQQACSKYMHLPKGGPTKAKSTSPSGSGTSGSGASFSQVPAG